MNWKYFSYLCRSKKKNTQTRYKFQTLSHEFGEMKQSRASPAGSRSASGRRVVVECMCSAVHVRTPWGPGAGAAARPARRAARPAARRARRAAAPAAPPARRAPASRRAAPPPPAARAPPPAHTLYYFADLRPTDLPTKSFFCLTREEPFINYITHRGFLSYTKVFY